MLNLQLPNLNNAFAEIIEALKAEYGTADLALLPHDQKYEVMHDFVRFGGHNLRNSINRMSTVLGVSYPTAFKMANASYSRLASGV